MTNPEHVSSVVSRVVGSIGGVLAIDASLAGTAYAFAQPGAPVYLERVSTKPASDVRGRLARYEQISTPIVELARQRTPALCLIEGYSFASAGGQVAGRAHDRAELGGVLRWRLRGHVGEFVEVAPSRLKKWACGKGNAPKAQVVSAASRRWGRDFRSDDEADAYALLMLGLVLVGVGEPENEAQREVVRALRETMESAA